MNFSSENNGVWFYFDEEDESKGGVCVRVLSVKMKEQLDNRYVKTKIEYKKGNRFEVPKTDRKGYDKAMWDECIVDWKEVSIDGKPAECTAENKLHLMERSVAFANFLVTSMEALSESASVDSENEAKNSE